MEPSISPPRQCVACGRQFGWDMNVCPYCGKDYRPQTYGTPPMQQKAPVQQKSKGSIAGGGVGIIGSILILIGIFLPWISYTILGITVISLSGWDLNTIAVQAGFTPLWEVMGLLVMGVLCMVASGLEFVNGKIPGLLAMVGGIIAILVAFFAWNELSNITSLPGVSVGFGIIISAAGSIMISIGGLIGLAK